MESSVVERITKGVLQEPYIAQLELPKTEDSQTTQLKITPPLRKKKHLRNTVNKMFEFVDLVGIIKKTTRKE